MKNAVRIKTMSQWYLLKQFNDYLGKKRVPEEVMRAICHILYSKELGKDGYVVLCLDKIADDFYGIEDAVGMYPNKLKLSERIDEIRTRSRKGKIRSWYVSYIKIKRQKIRLIYTTKGQGDYRRDGE